MRTRNRETDELLIRVADGDELAFERLVREVTPMLRHRAVVVLRSSDLAEEVVQNVLLGVWRRADRFDPERGSAMAWLSVITSRAALDMLRTEQRQERNLALTEALVTTSPDPQDHVETQDLRQRFDVAIETLSTSQRTAIKMAFHHDLSYREVARRMNSPEGTAKSRIRRGLSRLSVSLPNAGVAVPT